MIVSNPKARDIYSSVAPKESLNGQHSFTMQTRENLKFANETSLISGINQYYKAWPPAFPAALYFLNMIKISPHVVNLLIYVLNLAWFYYYLKKFDMSAAVKYLILFSYSIGAFHFYNLAIQVVSEGLFILTAQLIFTLILNYSGKNNYQTVIGLAVLTAFSILIKYFGLLWILPMVSICIFIFSQNTVVGLRNIAVYGIVAILPTIPWFIWIYKETGHFTGWDRSSERLISHLTDFNHNLFFSLKTCYVDFFSRDWASHSIITGRYDLRTWDFIVLVLLSVTVISICKIIIDRIKERAFIKPWSIRDFIRDEPLLFLLLMFVCSYFVFILTLWTIGNNDPIYTRFLYPSYPFIVLTIVKLYDLFMKKAYHPYYSQVFSLLFFTILGSQAYKIIVLLNRYMMS
jgi:hypothetical protein